MSTHDTCVIRPATIDDAEAIGSMVDEFRSYLQALGDPDAGVNFGSEQYRRDGFGDNRAFDGLVAQRGDDLLGYALYALEYSTDTGRRNLFIHDLFVRAVHRGQGVGEALMTRVADICRAAGGDSIVWGVWQGNEAAIRFYEKLGARSIDNVRLMRLEV